MTQNRCKNNDFGVFLSLWNVTQNITTPAIHFQIAIWLQKCWELGHRHLLLQAFRASGKSTLAGMFCAWILCHHPDTRILVLSAESTLAEKMVRTIRKVIEKHPLTRHLRPDNPDQWAADSFTIKRNRVSRDPSVLARGIYANTTGARADIIICDDVEVPNTCDTADKREKLRERLVENDFILTPGGTQLYIGTPHTYYTIYADAPRTEIGETREFLHGYERLSIPIENGNGASVWPERYSRDAIDDLRRKAGPVKFSSQMMLVPANTSDSRLDVKLLRRYEDELHYKEVQKEISLSLAGKKLVSASAWWDPAFGGGKGDSSVLAVAFTDEDGDQWLHRIVYIIVRPEEGEDEATLQCQVVARVARDLYLPLITVETNGIGKFLPAILRRELAAIKIPCAVKEEHSRHKKEDRILKSFDAIMAARALHVHASVYKTPFITEMAEWIPSSGGRDDGLDAAAGALSLEPMRLKRHYYTKAKIWSGSGSGYVAASDFDV
jgi:hypothetical protein